ncbi:MAG: M20 family metallopeptidase [Planctomycetes bacterium]|nr:M20 family metallopeptidase [Planctomycetota bacterium]
MSSTTQLLHDLVKLPSVNPMGRDLPAGICGEQRVTDYLETFFRDLGVPLERQLVTPGRENIIARFDCASAKATLLWEVHQDTVPVDHMTIDPFGAVIDGNRLYGRGACDIKGGMAAMLTAFSRLVREKPESANVVLACTADEEYTFLGVQELVKRGIRADMAIVAEPTGLDIVLAHKGVARWYVTTAGRACHSSSPEQGVNAIYCMSRIMPAIESYAEKLRKSANDALLGPATLSVGRIEGGTSVNTVPDRCRIEVDRRLVRGERPEDARCDFVGALEAQVDESFECSKLHQGKMALDPTGADELIDILGKAIDGVRGKHSVHAVAYCTDAPCIAATGIPTVVFGPGDIAQAHTKDEWVALDEVEMAAEVLYQLARAAPLAG